MGEMTLSKPPKHDPQISSGDGEVFRLTALARASRRFAETALDPDALPHAVVSEVGSAFDGAVALQFHTTEIPFGALTVHHPVAEGEAQMRESLLGSYEDVAGGIRSKTIAGEESVLVPSIELPPSGSQSSAWFRKYPAYAAMCTNVRANGKSIGTITVFRIRQGETFTASDLELLEELASRAEVSMETSRLLANARATEERLQLALDAGRMGAWEFNVGTGKVSWSATLEQIHGIPVGSFGGTFADYQSDIHPEDKPRVLATIAQTSKGKGEHHLVYRIVRPDGAVRWLDATGQLFCDAFGNPLRMLGVCSDVTERVEAEEQRRQLLERTEGAVRAREDLLAMVSHDLRNPLSVIVMTSALQLKTLADPKAKLQADRIRAAAKRMEELITNLLDASSIEVGNFNITPADVPLATLINDSLEVVSPLASQKGVALEVRVDDFDISVACDKARVGQVLGNLLSNAIKFSPSGETVVVEARIEGKMVEFSVRDSGPGVPEDHLTRVFERYWKGKQSGRAGTGLGLFIAKGIVDAHGGRIWVESGQGKGSVFCCTLPLSRRASINP